MSYLRNFTLNCACNVLVRNRKLTDTHDIVISIHRGKVTFRKSTFFYRIEVEISAVKFVCKSGSGVEDRVGIAICGVKVTNIYL